MAIASKIYLIISIGFLLAFISLISAGFKLSTAAYAALRAGMAPSSAIKASFFSTSI